MKSPLIYLYLLLAGASMAQQPKVDPVVSAWRLEDGRMLKFREDKSTAVWTEGKAPLEGTWELDPFSEAIRRYSVKWDNGQTWDMELAKDFSLMRAVNESGKKNAGMRVEELMAHFRSDDTGTVAVNGTVVMNAPTKETVRRIFLGKGDVLTVLLAKRKMNISFVMEIFRGNESIISARNFRYSPAPDPDWRTTAKLKGFQVSLTAPMKNFAFGNVREPLYAMPQEWDAGFPKLHFKYVMP